MEMRHTLEVHMIVTEHGVFASGRGENVWKLSWRSKV